MLILDSISFTLKRFHILFGEGKTVQKLTKHAISFRIWISVYIIIFLYVYILCMNILILHQVHPGFYPSIFVYSHFPPKIQFLYCLLSSLFHLMCEIRHAHTSTRTTSLMCVKNSMCQFCLWHLLSGTFKQGKWMKERKTSNLIADHSSLTFVNLLLAWMLYFHVWLQNKGKFLV